jgi:hypothetical protein
MLFTKNTLSLSDTIGALAHMARVSIEYYGDLNRLPTTGERTQIMNNYLTNGRGKCSLWHASKLTRAGVELAVSVLENNELRDLAIESYLPFSPDADQEGMDKILQSHAATIVSIQRLG